MVPHLDTSYFFVNISKTYDFYKSMYYVSIELCFFLLLLVYLEDTECLLLCTCQGLALLQKHGNLPESQTDLMEASHELMQEAASLHPFAEACYTVLIPVGGDVISAPASLL